MPFSTLTYTLWLTVLLFARTAMGQSNEPAPNNPNRQDVLKTLKRQVLTKAGWAIKQAPITVTAASSPRSAGGQHDFFSEGDYWWPNPEDPNGAYIQRDGQSNPDNFTAHRKAMIRFSQIVGSLASAYVITHHEKYARQALVHLNAWFIDENTCMNPSLLYAQAIKGKATGRGTGLIDMIQLMEVAQGIRVMQQAKVIKAQELKKIKSWFVAYLDWVTTHPYGIEERDAKNNHGTCWVMQVASFAKLTGNQTLIDYCKNRYKTVLLPTQMEKDGRFPLELRRTKPYGYSLFNLDAMTTICQILAEPTDNLWTFATPDGRTLKQAVAYLHPFVANKSRWTLKPDVMYWNNWPVAQPFLVFGAMAYNQPEWFITWQKLDHQPTLEEVIRNLPVRNPLIWLN
jgi:Alginate lyase